MRFLCRGGCLWGEQQENLRRVQSDGRTTTNVESPERLARPLSRPSVSLCDKLTDEQMKETKKNIGSSERGLGIIEALVSAALLSIVIMGAMKMTASRARLATAGDARMDISQVRDYV